MVASDPLIKTNVNSARRSYIAAIHMIEPNGTCDEAHRIASTPTMSRYMLLSMILNNQGMITRIAAW
jgi:hypothetical protein